MVLVVGFFFVLLLGFWGVICLFCFGGGFWLVGFHLFFKSWHVLSYLRLNVVAA